MYLMRQSGASYRYWHILNNDVQVRDGEIVGWKQSHCGQQRYTMGTTVRSATLTSPANVCTICLDKLGE